MKIKLNSTHKPNLNDLFGNMTFECDIHKPIANALGLEVLPECLITAISSQSLGVQKKLLARLSAIIEYLDVLKKNESPVIEKINSYFERQLSCFKEIQVDENVKEDIDGKIDQAICQAINSRLTPIVTNVESDFFLNPNSVHEMMEKIIISACAFGGLAFKEGLEELLCQLQTIQAPLICMKGDIALGIEDHFALDLHYNRPHHNTNLILENTYADSSDHKQPLNLKSNRRWRVDNLTTLMICQYLNLREKNNMVATVTIQNIVDSIKKKTKLIGQGVNAQHIFTSICHIGLRCKRTEIPNFLVEFATGKVFSGSTQIESLETYHRPNLELRNGHVTKLKENASLNKKDNNSSFDKFQVELHQGRTMPYKDRELLLSLEAYCEREIATHDNTITRAELISNVTEIYGQRDRLSLPAEVLVGWILNGLTKPNAWEFGKRTAYRYIMITWREWLDVWSKEDITQVGEDQIHVILSALEDKIFAEQKIVKNSMKSLIDYMRSKYASVIACPANDKVTKGNRHTRSMIVPEWIFQQVRKDFYEIFADEKAEWREAADLCLIIAYRCGLRPNEIYQLGLSYISRDANFLYIKKSKTQTGKRRIPLSVLLTEQEHQALFHYLSKRLISVNKNKVPLFSKSMDLNEELSTSIVNTVCTELISNYCKIRTVSYQFRHTAISNVMLVCFCDEKTARQYTSYSSTYIAKMKNHFCKNPSRTLNEIKRTFGHLSIKTTLSWYAHLTDLILHDFISKQSFKLDFKHIARALGMTSKNILRQSEILSDKSPDHIDLDSLTSVLHKKLRRFVHKTIVINGNHKQHFQPNYMQEKLPYYRDLEEIILRANQEDTDMKIASALNINIDFIRSFLNQNNMLIKHDNRFMTNPGESTIVRDKDAKYGVPYLHEKIERDDAHNLFQAMIYREKIKLQNLHALDPILKASNEHPYAIISTIREAKKVINILKTIIDDEERIIISIDTSINDDNTSKYKLLRDMLPSGCCSFTGEIVTSKKYRNGRIKVSLQHPNASKRKLYNKDYDSYGYQRHSTKSLKTALVYALCYKKAMAELKAKPQQEDPQQSFEF
jgi:integrase